MISSRLDIKLACWLNGFVKTTLDLPEDLVQELKLRSVHERKKLKDVAAQVLRRGLGISSPAVARKKEISFPLFESGPDAPASKMTAEELIALEQRVVAEEDVKRGGLPL
jgi:hypothetical protein